MTEFVYLYQEILHNSFYLLLLGERRIRVHTLCLPVVSSLADVYAGADVQAVVCLLANMGEYRPGRFKSLFVCSQFCQMFKWSSEWSLSIVEKGWSGAHWSLRIQKMTKSKLYQDC